MSLVAKTILQLLTDPKVRVVTLPHIHEWMFDRGRDQALFKLLSDEQYRGVIPDTRAVVLTLHNKYRLSRDDIEYAVDVVESARESPIDRIDEVVTAIQEFVQEKYLASGVETLATSTTPDSRNQGLEDIKKAVNIVISGDQFYDFSNISHIETAKNSDFPEDGVIIKSAFQLINNSSNYGGYKYGDLIMFAAAPGIGKSTAMVNEGASAILQGFRVCHLFLGDMSEFDGFMMYLSKWTRTPTEVILREGHEAYLNDDIVERFSRLRVKAWPSDTFTVTDLVGKLSHLYDAFPFNMLIIDYDLNIKPLSDSMYLEGGSTYGILKGFGSQRCVVVIGSQTKPAYWECEVVPKEAPAESSKKQHHIDGGFGIGKNANFKGVGTGNLFKWRRGISDIQVRLKLDYKHASITEIYQNTYERLIREHCDRASDLMHGIDISNLLEESDSSE